MSMTDEELDALDGLRAWIEAEAEDRGTAEAFYPPERQCAPALVLVTALRAERGSTAKSAENLRLAWARGIAALEKAEDERDDWKRRAEAAEARVAELSVQPGAPVTLLYTNWKGETAPRRIIPRRVWWGSTEWHPEPQWFLSAFDMDKEAERDFALKDFGQPTTSSVSLRITGPNSDGEYWLHLKNGNSRESGGINLGGEPRGKIVSALLKAAAEGKA